MITLEDLKEELAEVNSALAELESRQYTLGMNAEYNQNKVEYERLLGQRIILKRLIGLANVKEKYSVKG